MRHKLVAPDSPRPISLAGRQPLHYHGTTIAVQSARPKLARHLGPATSRFDWRRAAVDLLEYIPGNQYSSESSSNFWYSEKHDELVVE